MLTLQGVAHSAEKEPLPTDELPPQLFKHWIHSHEEDTDEIEVYRPSGHAFPPSRGRSGFEIQADGTFIQHDIGPADGVQRIVGRWKAESARRTWVELEGEEPRSFTLVILVVDEQVLRVSRE